MEPVTQGEPKSEQRSSEQRSAEPATIVVVGGAGDLMRRKLFPALYRLAGQGLLHEHTQILGVARRQMDDQAYRAWASEALEEAGAADERATRWCEACLFYHSLGEGTSEDYRGLAARLDSLERAHEHPGNRTLYLAIPPKAIPTAVAGLGEAGLNRSAGWTRLVVEKPFGRDPRSAQELNGLIHRHFEESQVYRIDHYLGKETVQNLLAFRFANPIFETLWNRDRVESVQITVAEEVGVEDRADYYETAGALRDIVQNHLTQLLTLVAMEVPASPAADMVRNEKVKVLHVITPVTEDDVVFGQYTRGTVEGREVPAYREEPGISPSSRVDTFVALRLRVENWRWHGVPFYLRTGKRLARRLTQIAVTFRRAPVALFPQIQDAGIPPNVLVITIQPDEGFDLSFQVKTPGEPITLATQRLDFRYAEAFAPLPEAYETLLLDVLAGDQTLFVRADEAEMAWSLYVPVLEDRRRLAFYPAGSWGPAEADRIFLSPGERWLPDSGLV